MYLFGKYPEEFFCKRIYILKVLAAYDCCKFIAACSSKTYVIIGKLSPAAGNLAKDNIAAGVTHCVVDILEVVKVEKQQVEWLAALNKAVNVLKDTAAVIKTCK